MRVDKGRALIRTPAFIFNKGISLFSERQEIAYRLIRVKPLLRKLQHFKSAGKYNSLWYWHKAKNPLIIIINFLVISLGRIMPSMAVKNFLYRLVGMKIGRHVSIGLLAMFDVFFPELIEIGDNCIIGYNATLICHEFKVDSWAKGKIRIGKNVLIATNSTVLAGVEIGDNSIVSAMSLVNRDVPENVMVGGVPANFIKNL